MKAFLLASFATFALAGAASAMDINLNTAMPRNETVSNKVTGSTYQASHGMHFGMAGATKGVAQGFSVGTQNTSAFSSASGCNCTGIKGEARVNGKLEQGAIATVGQMATSNAPQVSATGTAGAAAGGIQGATAGYTTRSSTESRRTY
ncbi:MAG TPA: hypothetical protein VHK66_00530 [Microvirga sp.]|jgi:hypothetical protein|nr:hypothetical protein [Microvirga sp.]